MSYQDAKRAILARGRRVILNNDGGDITKADFSDMAQPRDFLKTRTTPLIGSQVDTIFYCTHGGFGMCRHNSKIGQVSENPLTSALIEQGTDPLGVMVEYAHGHGMEVFWSMRMNDTHDGYVSRADIFAANRFKRENPECLLGSPYAKLKHGIWSAVDYGSEKVRELALALIEDICVNYDVDGIELDFFRHPVFFRQTAEGLPVDDAARGQMTGLLRKVADVARREGIRRGRPFLIAVRTPDDADYAATIGLEIERWMSEGLIDIFIPSAYFRLRCWRDSIELGHGYGVKVYPCLSESRVGGGCHADGLRASDECYRARSANVWQAGADGIYLFNLFDPQRRIWREIGSQETLKSTDKLYFASVLGAGRVAGGAYPHIHYITISTLNPGAPIAIEPEGRRVVRIEMAENIEATSETNSPAMMLSLGLSIGGDTSAPPIGIEHELTVVFNGKSLLAGLWADGLISFALSPDDARQGWNTVEIFYRGARNDLQLFDAMVKVDYSGKFMADTSYLNRTRNNM